MEGGGAPAGAKVTRTTIKTRLLNKFISFLAVLSWKTWLIENVENIGQGHQVKVPAKSVH